MAQRFSDFSYEWFFSETYINPSQHGIMNQLQVPCSILPQNLGSFSYQQQSFYRKSVVKPSDLYMKCDVVGWDIFPICCFYLSLLQLHINNQLGTFFWHDSRTSIPSWLDTSIAYYLLVHGPFSMNNCSRISKKTAIIGGSEFELIYLNWIQGYLNYGLNLLFILDLFWLQRSFTGALWISIWVSLK